MYQLAYCTVPQDLLLYFFWNETSKPGQWESVWGFRTCQNLQIQTNNSMKL